MIKLPEAGGLKLLLNGPFGIKNACVGQLLFSNFPPVLFDWKVEEEILVG